MKTQATIYRTPWFKGVSAYLVSATAVSLPFGDRRAAHEPCCWRPGLSTRSLYSGSSAPFLPYDAYAVIDRKLASRTRQQRHERSALHDRL